MVPSANSVEKRKNMKAFNSTKERRKGVERRNIVENQKPQCLSALFTLKLENSTILQSPYIDFTNRKKIIKEKTRKKIITDKTPYRAARARRRRTAIWKGAGQCKTS